MQLLRDVAQLFLREVVKHHGVPEYLFGDRDQLWTGSFWRSLFRRLGTRPQFPTACHPQTDGQAERANRTIEEALRIYVASGHRPVTRTNGREGAMMAQFAYNISTHSLTGATPFMPDYGRRPCADAFPGRRGRSAACC